MKVRCDNCGLVCDESEIIPLTETPGLSERLDPGSTVPAGECRKCGALAYQQPEIGKGPDYVPEQIWIDCWDSLIGAGLNPEDWMMMEWQKQEDSFWNGEHLFHFKHRNSRLYVFIPSNWAKYHRGEDYSGVQKVQR